MVQEGGAIIVFTMIVWLGGAMLSGKDGAALTTVLDDDQETCSQSAANESNPVNTNITWAKCPGGCRLNPGRLGLERSHFTEKVEGGWRTVARPYCIWEKVRFVVLQRTAHIPLCPNPPRPCQALEHERDGPEAAWYRGEELHSKAGEDCTKCGEVPAMEPKKLCHPDGFASTQKCESIKGFVARRDVQMINPTSSPKDQTSDQYCSQVLGVSSKGVLPGLKAQNVFEKVLQSVIPVCVSECTGHCADTEVCLKVTKDTGLSDFGKCHGNQQVLCCDAPKPICA